MSLKKLLHHSLMLLLTINIYAQEIYIVNNANEIKVVDGQFNVTDLFTIDINEAGYITDLAFSPNGSLYGVTNQWTIIEIDLNSQTFSFVANLPTGDSYTALICNNNNELLTSRYLSQELYSYNLLTGELYLIASDISTPGDFTYFKGNLVYPNIFNDFIRSYDGSSTKNIGCAVPLLYSFVNQFEDCNTNTIYGIDEDGKVYLYDLEGDSYEEVADLFSETDIINGAATMTEYMASTCPLTLINETACNLGLTDNLLDSLSIIPNPVELDLRLNFDGSILDDYQFEVLDVFGRVYQKGMLAEREIGLSYLQSGVYYIRIKTPLGVSVKVEKIIKK